MDLRRRRLFVCKVLHRVLYPRRTKMYSKKKKKRVKAVRVILVCCVVDTLGPFLYSQALRRSEEITVNLSGVTHSPAFVSVLRLFVFRLGIPCSH
jgi:hypothetical protein